VQSTCDGCGRQLTYEDRFQPGKRWHRGVLERGAVVAAYRICEGCEDQGLKPLTAALLRAERISRGYLAYLQAGFAIKKADA
jgi:hypothetical protein